MKRILLVAFLLALFSCFVPAQVPVQIKIGPTLPATCAVSNLRTVLFYKTGTSPGLYQCLTANTWTAQGGGSGVGSLYFDQNHVNYGQFWHAGTTYDSFFWEFWIKPAPSVTGYLLSAGYGGAHELLFGINSDATGAVLIGKYYSGSTDYGTVERLPVNQWSNVAIGWDGTSLVFWINGCIATVVPETTARSTTATSSNGQLFIGGSNHSYYKGYIAQIRGYEGSMPWNHDYFVERYFRPLRYDLDANTYSQPQFFANYMAPGTVFPDLSEGFDDGSGTKRLHHGALGGLEISASNGAYSGNPFPLFVSGDISAPTYAPTAPATPSGAKAFDSFSRADTSYAFIPDTNAAGTPLDHVGSTEAGTAGVLRWSRQDWVIRDGRLAYWYQRTDINTVDVPGSADADVSVKRLATADCSTGLVIRYTDANNYDYVKGYPTQIVTGKVVAGVNTTLDSTTGVPSSYVSLRAVVSGTSMTVYRDTTVVATVTVPASAATRHGVIAPGSGTKQVNRFDDFLVK